MSEGTQAIITYFTLTKGTGNKNTIDERRLFALPLPISVSTSHTPLDSEVHERLSLSHQAAIHVCIFGLSGHLLHIFVYIENVAR
jgi:hypothetical protein